MAGGGASSNASRLRKRVEADTSSSSASALKRAKDGSAFAKCEECNKDVPVALISFHNCSLDAKIKMNLEAQVVEMPSEAKKKPAAEKRKSKQTEPKSKKEKKAKNPNKLKRPPTAFFVFMDDFRKTFKEANPDCKSVATVGKEGGLKWKSMTDEEKKVYIERAAELKAEYEKALEESNEAENEQDADDTSEKEVKEEEVDDSSDKEVKDEVEEDDE
ncbi:hypothetical protein DH2020_020480 [Rehmannia glutinosa]|uniref:HMG box domain-containing protein n=1 Tax=Rehmannia glutinosa TaxID=99300 RepID=A0ABR0WJ25_REHGL